MTISKNITGEYFIISHKDICPVYEKQISEAIKKAYEQLVALRS